MTNTEIKKGVPRNVKNYRYDQSECTFKDSDTNLQMYFNIQEEEINCNTIVKSPRRIKKKEYSEFFENLVETNTLNLTEQRDFTNANDNKICRNIETNKANNTILNEITEDDTKDTSDPVIVNNLSNHARPQKLRKKETSCMVMYFMPKKKETFKFSALKRFY